MREPVPARTSPVPRIVDEAALRAGVDLAGAIGSAREAFQAVWAGRAVVPPPWNLAVPEADGDFHVKGAHLPGQGLVVIKTATGFENNAARGLPPSSGFFSVFDAQTGMLLALLLDNGYLTDLRTAAGGAVASDALARAEIESLVVLGSGVQAGLQLEAHLAVRTPGRITIVGRDLERTEALAAGLRDRLGRDIRATTDREGAVRSADLIVTTTPARSPVVDAAWVRPGAHITAVGSDATWKRELDPALLRRAHVVAVDDLAQSQRLGELKDVALHDLTAAPVPLGAILAGAEPGRRSATDVTIADLSGLGVQDAAIAALALALALRDPS